KGSMRTLALLLAIVGGYFLVRSFYDPAVQAIEADNPASSGFLGGAGLPIILSWAVGGLFAAGVAWLIGKVALGLRSDYLAIATLGIAEILIAIMKNEDWLTRGVKNVTGLPRPVPYEIDLQQDPGFQQRAAALGVSPVDLSSLAVKLAYAGMFAAVLIALLFLAERAWSSPWGRMMRAIRDNETAAGAMGKNVTARHTEAFVLGSAVIGIAGAMLVTLDGQFTPTSYQPLRFTFLIWVMVIVGGSGNNYGAIIGGFLVWFAWIQAEPLGTALLGAVTAGLPEGDPIRDHLVAGAAYMRLMVMGAILLLALRFAPRGLLPERRGGPG
ncbi:MAG: branched-chain amino acid ABC transporter permease, partial [Pseudomonadota bacterium]